MFVFSSYSQMSQNINSHFSKCECQPKPWKKAIGVDAKSSRSERGSQRTAALYDDTQASTSKQLAPFEDRFIVRRFSGKNEIGTIDIEICPCVMSDRTIRWRKSVCRSIESGMTACSRTSLIPLLIPTTG